MTTRPSTPELAFWGALAFVGGCAVAWVDLTTSQVQTSVLFFMVLGFALTLPGRAPAWLVAAAGGAGLPVVRAIATHELNAAYLIAVVPTLFGAGGGHLAGRLLDVAASRLTEPEPQRHAWTRPLSRRVLLAVTLVAIAAAGLPMMRVSLAAHRAGAWLAIVWQIMTLLGWIGLTPVLLSTRKPASPLESPTELSAPNALGFARHVLWIVVLAAFHAAAVVTMSGLLLIPIEPSWLGLAARAFIVYLPLDALAYLAVLALGAASDVERSRREAAQRERALHAEMLDSRLDALRARLNPHFLFNALNSADVLARAGKAAETSRVLAGLTALLRYVLDDRTANVPLSHELAFARQYLDLQQIRFGDRLRYVVDVSPALERRAEVPQLLLQPIVENAVEHGIGGTLEGGVVRIAAAREGDWLRLTVEDEGPGAAGREMDASAGIGLASTRERLARLFEGRATLTLGPRADRGTRVIICIPYHETRSPT